MKHSETRIRDEVFMPLLAASTLHLLLTCTLNTAVSEADLSPQDTSVICYELGLAPESMAALRLSTAQVAEIVEELAEYASTVQQYRTLQSQMKSDIHEIRALSHKARTDPGPQGVTPLVQQIDQMRETVVQLKTQIESIQSQLRGSVLPGTLDTALVQRVCEPERDAWSLPVEFRVLDLSDAQIGDLLDALRAERHTQANSTTPDPGHSATLNLYRNHPAVLAASNHSQAYLPLLRQLIMNPQ